MLLDMGHEVKDCGTFSADMVDYPVFVRPAAEAVARGECARGIVLGGSGNGEAMVANKVKGVRCALCWNEATAKACREHNDANVLSLGERMITAGDGARDRQDLPRDAVRAGRRRRPPRPPHRHDRMIRRGRGPAIVRRP